MLATVQSVEAPQAKTATPLQLAGAIALLLVCLGLLSTVLYQNAANRDFISYCCSAKLLLSHQNTYAGQAVLGM